jgi:hypothetical protein
MWNGALINTMRWCISKKPCGQGKLQPVTKGFKDKRRNLHPLPFASDSHKMGFKLLFIVTAIMFIVYFYFTDIYKIINAILHIELWHAYVWKTIQTKLHKIITRLLLKIHRSEIFSSKDQMLCATWCSLYNLHNRPFKKCSYVSYCYRRFIYVKPIL